MLVGKTVGLHGEGLLQGGVQVAQVFDRSEMSHIGMFFVIFALVRFR